jgi:hypothetical protein
MIAIVTAVVMSVLLDLRIWRRDRRKHMDRPIQGDVSSDDEAGMERCLPIGCAPNVHVSLVLLPAARKAVQAAQSLR